MNGVFLNLPHKERVVRRYNCSYNAPTFLLPPYELLTLTSLFREYHGSNVKFIDSIAENRNLESVIEEIKLFDAEFILTIAGMEFIEDDILSIEEIKTKMPNVKVILFGYYAGEFAEQIMERANIDFIIHGEPDLIFRDLIHYFKREKEITDIKGISYRENGGSVVHAKGGKRIPDPNALPDPAYDLLNFKHYSEPFFPKPYAVLQSARGCPYTCNYCVKTFGTKLTALTPENMFRQVRNLVQTQHIKSYRFIDDTFTAIPERVIEFCKLLVENNLSHLKWSCFSRADTLNREMLEYMIKAGCTRIYFGMESGSQKVLNYYNKKYNINDVKDDIVFCKKLGFETIGLYMVGAPIETKEDLYDSIQSAIECKFDYITTFQLVMYPGTEIFNRLKEDIVFNVFPYENKFRDEKVGINAALYQKIFFRRFYFRFQTFRTMVRTIKKNGLKEVVFTGISFLKYIFLNKKNSKRNDYI